jgi:hypothetical protein
MFDSFRRLFGRGKQKPTPDPEGELGQAWYDRKTQLMVELLGPEHFMVMHAIIPYAIGGGLDLYYFPHGIPGTAIATKELSELPDQGPASRDFSCYEMVMFTRQPIDLDEAKNEATPFGRAHGTLNGILNCMARYSATTELNPYSTCEFPADMEDLGGKCLVCAPYGSKSTDEVKSFGLLALIEIHRSEMDFARASGGLALVERLKVSGYYPYSDLDRPPVA